MALWCHAHDPSRPVQYESCGGAACTDILCPMYPSDELIRRLNTQRGQLASSLVNGVSEPTRNYPASTYKGGMRPVIVCEYAHAMGNSTGNLDEWWHLFGSLPYCQGGFIWDWVDQGLVQTVPSAREGAAADGAAEAPAVTLADGTVLRGKRWAYGGDFGERVHDARFCINGLVGPGRRPHPGLLEVKRVLQPVAIELVGAQAANGKTRERDGAASVGVAAGGGVANSIAVAWRYTYDDTAAPLRPTRAIGSLRLTNHHSFRSLGGMRLALRLQLDGVVIGHGAADDATLTLPDVPPAQATEMNVIIKLLATQTPQHKGLAPPAWLPTPPVANPLWVAASPDRTAASGAAANGMAASGEVANGEAATAGQAPVARKVAAATGEALLEVDLLDPETPSWAHAAAHIVASAQLSVPPPPPPPPLSPSNGAANGAANGDANGDAHGGAGGDGDLSCAEDGERVLISGACDDGGRFSLVVDRTDGTIGPLLVDGQTVLERGGGALSVWRAPTENDQGCTLTSVAHPKFDTIAHLVWWYRILCTIAWWLPHWLFPPGTSHAGLWEHDGLDRLHVHKPSVTVVRQTAARIDVELRRELRSPRGPRRAVHTVRLTVLRGGSLHLANTADITTVHAQSLARVGLGFTLPRRAVGGHQLEWSARWHGRGPHENYPDRQRSATLGVHESSASALADDLTAGYVYPQHCSRRGDVRWLSLATATGRGVVLCGGAPFGFTLLPCSDRILADAAHPHEVAEALRAAELEGEPPSHHLTLDHRMMGVGGDVGWLPSVRDAYTVPPGTYSWSLLVRAVRAWPPPPGTALPADVMRTSRSGFVPAGRVTRAMNVLRMVLFEAPPLTRFIMTSVLLLLCALVAALSSHLA